MKNIIKALTHPMFISILGLIAIGVVIWFAGPAIAFNDNKPLETEMSRLIAILVITILWGLNNFRTQNKEKKKDAALMGDIAQSGDKKDISLDPRAAEEASALQKQFQNAAVILKNSKKQNDQSEKLPIHELPWYIIIGPPGSGKTTALINSGLHFPLAEQMGQQPLKGIGGTRNCDWWFSDEAILIDTAGRYTTQDSDQSADSSGWKNFLKLLKKHRPRQPINGAIVAISLAELMTMSETERKQHASQIKSRLQELNDNLGIQFPVYTLLTKTDLVAGFSEYFDNLSRQERQQIWGTTLKVSGDYESQFEIGQYKSNFDDLMRRLNDRLQWRMQDEKDISRRALILGFPSELAALKDITAQFLDNTFRPNNFEKAINLRGVYFTSGTQEGTPIDRVMGALAGNFGLNRQMVPSYSGQGKSFFLTHLFRNVIFPESMLAGTNRVHEQKQNWLRRTAYVLALVTTAASAGLWTTQYTEINAQIGQLTEHINDYNIATDALPEADQDPALLLKALNLLQTGKETANSDSRGFLSQAGLSQMRELGPAVDEAYLRTVHASYLPRLVNVIEDKLNDRNTNTDELFSSLKSYLMLSRKDKLDDEYIKQWFTSHWENQFPGDTDRQNSLISHLDVILETGFEPIDPVEKIVKNTRIKLQKIKLAKRIYTSIKQQAENTLEPFFFSNLLDSDEQQLFLNKSNIEDPLNGIAGLFTKTGYESFFMDESLKRSKASTADDWVFGKSDNPGEEKIDPDKLHKKIEALYIADFIKNWTKLYSSIKIVPFKNFEHSVEVLEMLAGDQTAIMTVLEGINTHTNLRNKPNLLQMAGSNLNKMGSAGKKAAKTKAANADIKLTPVGVKLRKHFKNLIVLTESVKGRPPVFQRHLTSLIKLQDYLGEMATAPEPDAAALQASIQRLKTSSKDEIGLLRKSAKRLPNPVNGWVKAISVSSWRIMLKASRRQINEQWSNEVLNTYNNSIKNRYPIFKSKKQQTSLEDFTDFFGTEGEYPKFVAKNIKPFLKVSVKSWRLKTIEGQNIGFSKKTLKQLRLGEYISKAFFPANSEEIRVKFRLKPSTLDARVKRFTLKLDDEKIHYRHGPTRSSSHSWPFTDDPEASKVSIRFRTSGKSTTITKKGTWAFFQLLDISKVKFSSNADKIKITFTKDGYTAKYGLKANSTTNPFNLGKIHAFRSPKTL